MKGVTGVSNMIQLKPSVPPPSEIRQKIESAFKRSAEVDANKIRVEAHEGKVILKGNLGSWAARREAVSTAWSAPGVSQVDDLITITPEGTER